MPSVSGTELREDRASPSGAVAVGALALALAAMLFHRTIAGVVETWSLSNTYNHDFLIVPLCLYLCWRQRAQLSAARPQPSALGIALGALASFGWLVGSATGTLVVQQLSLVGIFQGIMLTIYGWSICRILAFPLLYLYFAVPLGEDLVPPLQSITATICIAMLKGVGIPVYADGNVISVPNGDFYIAEACSGIRYLIASFVLGVLFAGITYRSWSRRILFVAISVIIPILANGIRAFGIIVIAHLTSNEFASGIDHLIYGWLFFSFVTLATLAIGMTFRDAEPPRPLPAPATRVEPGKSMPRLLLAGVLALSPGALATLYGNHIDHRPSAVSAELRPPVVALPWLPAGAGQDRAMPIFAAPDAQLHATYEASGAKVFLHFGYYAYDRQNAKVVSSLHRLVGEGNSTVVTSGSTSTILDGASLTVQFIRTTRGRQGHLTWYWYWVGDRFTANPYAAKLIEAKVRLLGGEQASAIIVIDADYDDDPDTAEQALRSFCTSLEGLNSVLRNASRG